jgi:hypothetical protein
MAQSGVSIGPQAVFSTWLDGGRQSSLTVFADMWAYFENLAKPAIPPWQLIVSDPLIPSFEASSSLDCCPQVAQEASLAGLSVLGGSCRVIAAALRASGFANNSEPLRLASFAPAAALDANFGSDF